jgi:hypothetical protein
MFHRIPSAAKGNGDKELTSCADVLAKAECRVEDPVGRNMHENGCRQDEIKRAGWNVKRR